MIRRFRIRILAFVLSVAMLTAASPAAWASWHAETHFSQMEYRRPEPDEGLAYLDKALELSVDAKNAYQVYANLGLFDNYMSEVLTQYQLAYINWCRDVASGDYFSEYVYAEGLVNELYIRYQAVLEAVVKSPCGEVLGFTQEDIDALDGVPETEHISSLKQRESELMQSYSALAGGEYGESGAAAVEISAGALTEYYETKNKLMGDIYLQLVQVRGEIAKAYGFESAAEYYYEYNARDYTPDQARGLHSYVKQYIAPVYQSILEAFLELDAVPMDRLSLSYQDCLEILGELVDNYYPQMRESYDYMMRNGLYDMSGGGGRKSAGFTLILTKYNAPFIFLGGLDSDSDIQRLSDVIHEFGHYNSMYNSGGSINLDLAETDSQGFELMTAEYYGDYMDADTAYAAKLYKFVVFINTIIAGCLYDEFQQEVYENPNMTREQVNSLFEALCAEYGVGMGDYARYVWVDVHHNFEAPFYYISYAAAMIPAVELWSVSVDSPADAAYSYFSIVNRRTRSEDFLSELDLAGLGSPFEESTIKAIAAKLESLTQIPDAAYFADTEGHWARRYIEFLSSRGVVAGTGQGLFEPDALITRGMAVAMLGRIYGAGQTASDAYTDVAPDSYYGGYVGWACDNGLLDGFGDGMFYPDEPIERQELAVLLYRFSGLSQDGGETGFTDADRIDPWAAEAVTALKTADVVRGNAGGEFEPEGYTTRAEACAMLVRLVELVPVE